MILKNLLGLLATLGLVGGGAFTYHTLTHYYESGSCHGGGCSGAVAPCPHDADGMLVDADSSCCQGAMTVSAKASKACCGKGACCSPDAACCATGECCGTESCCATDACCDGADAPECCKPRAVSAKASKACCGKGACCSPGAACCATGECCGTEACCTNGACCDGADAPTCCKSKAGAVKAAK